MTGTRQYFSVFIPIDNATEVGTCGADSINTTCQTNNHVGLAQVAYSPRPIDGDTAEGNGGSASDASPAYSLLGRPQIPHKGVDDPAYARQKDDDEGDTE
jgi:hypothetical protein